MAETLTYDAGTDTVTTEENLNADEQDSLQVGEAMVEQQEQLLAGKYKNAEELESAYVELQKKLGDRGKEEKEEVTEEEPTEAKDEQSKQNVLDKLWEEAQTKEYSKETLDELKNMSSEDLANLHLQYRKENSSQRPKDFTPKEV